MTRKFVKRSIFFFKKKKKERKRASHCPENSKLPPGSGVALVGCTASPASTTHVTPAPQCCCPDHPSYLEGADRHSEARWGRGEETRLQPGERFGCFGPNMKFRVPSSATTQSLPATALGAQVLDLNKGHTLAAQARRGIKTIAPFPVATWAADTHRGMR